MTILRRLRVVIHLFGSLNAWSMEKLTWREWLYGRRIGFDTAWKIAKIAHPGKRDKQ